MAIGKNAATNIGVFVSLRDLVFIFPGFDANPEEGVLDPPVVLFRIPRVPFKLFFTAATLIYIPINSARGQAISSFSLIIVLSFLRGIYHSVSSLFTVMPLVPRIVSCT